MPSLYIQPIPKTLSSLPCFGNMTKFKKLFIYLGFFTLLLLGYWYMIFKDTNVLSRSNLLERGTLKPFSFVNQDSQQVTQHDLIGKVCVVNYFFTTCPGICPRMNNNMKKVYETFKNESDILFVSHTCKPETDHIPELKHYADSLSVNTRKWIFLTGRKDSLYNMARFCYGIDDPKNIVNNIEDDFIHSQFFALVDKSGKIRGAVYDGLKKDEMEKLTKDISSLLKEKRSQFANNMFGN